MKPTNLNPITLFLLSLSPFLLPVSAAFNETDFDPNISQWSTNATKSNTNSSLSQIKNLCRIAYEPLLCENTVGAAINPDDIDPDTVLYTELNVTQDENGQALADAANKVMRFIDVHQVWTDRYKKCTSFYYAALEELLAAEDAVLAQDPEKVNSLAGKAISYWRRCDNVFLSQGVGSPLSIQNSYLERLARNCMTLGRAIKKRKRKVFRSKEPKRRIVFVYGVN